MFSVIPSVKPAFSARFKIKDIETFNHGSATAAVGSTGFSAIAAIPGAHSGPAFTAGALVGHGSVKLIKTLATVKGTDPAPVADPTPNATPEVVADKADAPKESPV